MTIHAENKETDPMQSRWNTADSRECFKHVQYSCLDRSQCIASQVQFSEYYPTQLTIHRERLKCSQQIIFGHF